MLLKSFFKNLTSGTDSGLKTGCCQSALLRPQPLYLPSILFVVLSAPQRPNHVRRTASKGLSHHLFVAESPVIEPTVEEWL
jgi:hypothetical protein